MEAAVTSPHRRCGAAASAAMAAAATPLEALVAAPGLQRLPVDVLKIAAAFARFTWNILSCAVPRPLVFECNEHGHALNNGRCGILHACITPRGSVVGADSNGHISVCAAHEYTWHTLDPNTLLAATGGDAASRVVAFVCKGVFCVRTDGVVLASFVRGVERRWSSSTSDVPPQRWVVAIRVERVREGDARLDILWALNVSRFETSLETTQGLSSHATSTQCAAIARTRYHAGFGTKACLRVGHIEAHGALADKELTLPLLDAYARWDICDAGVLQVHRTRVWLHAWHTGTQLLSVNSEWPLPIANPRTASAPYHVAVFAASSTIHLLTILVNFDESWAECSGEVVAFEAPLPVSSTDAIVAEWHTVAMDRRVLHSLRCNGIAHVQPCGTAALFPETRDVRWSEILRFG